jgi:hypothetical protein
MPDRSHADSLAGAVHRLRDVVRKATLHGRHDAVSIRQRIRMTTMSTVGGTTIPQLLRGCSANHVQHA